jgi:hypothetical protein
MESCPADAADGLLSARILHARVSFRLSIVLPPCPASYPYSNPLTCAGQGRRRVVLRPEVTPIPEVTEAGACDDTQERERGAADHGAGGSGW